MKRRDFLKTGLTVSIGGMLIPRWIHPLLSHTEILREPTLNRVLVLINLGGGNDGLNTVVPFGDDEYYNHRPTVNISPGDAIPLNELQGFHPNLEPLMNLWNDGKLGIIQNIGYDNQDLSHFRSTDIWRSATDVDVFLNTGWVGRYLETVYSDYITNPPINPLALQQGSSNSLLLTGDSGVPGVIVDNPSIFYALVGETYESEYDNNPPGTLGGDELSYIRQIDTNSFNYAAVIQEASEAGTNTVEYPNTFLGSQLAITAQLLSGGMYTPFFMIHHNGYDTHANQLNDQGNLLADLANSISAFQQDITNLGIEKEILTMTTSEFGRRPFQNGSNGTDHGAGAPHFMIGHRVKGGFYGNMPDLFNFDNNGNLVHEFDFRQLYTTLLKYWFNTPNSTIESVLFGDFDVIPVLDTYREDPHSQQDPYQRSADGDGLPAEYALHPAYPNPFNANTTIKYSVMDQGLVHIRVYDLRGKLVSTLVKSHHSPGYYSVKLNADRWASGMYEVVMKTRNIKKVQKIQLVK